jgi:hypothetical protein
MRTYRLVVSPDVRLAAHGLLSLTEDVLAEEISDIVVRELSETHFGWRIIDVELRRRDDAEALDEIVLVLERLGFSLVEATVSKWASLAAERVLGGLGGFAVGAGISENLAVGIVTSAIGTLVGHLAGEAGRQIAAEYEARRDHRGRWAFEEVPRQPSVSPGFQRGILPV